MKLILSSLALTASVSAFTSEVTRRGLCSQWQLECSDGSCTFMGGSCPDSGPSCPATQTACPSGDCAYHLQSCGYAAGGDWTSAGAAYYTTSSYVDYVNDCDKNDIDWSTCASVAGTSGWTDYSQWMGQYPDYQDFATSPYYEAAEYYNDDYTYNKYVDDVCMDGCDWAATAAAGQYSDYSDWSTQGASYAGNYGSYADWQASPYYSKVWTSGDWETYADGEWAKYGAQPKGWQSYVTDYSRDSYSSWGDYADAANDKAYGDWRNLAKAAGKYDSYESYTNSISYKTYTQRDVVDWTGFVTFVGAQPANEWGDFMKEAKGYSDWKSLSKYAGKAGSYEAWKASSCFTNGNTYVKNCHKD